MGFNVKTGFWATDWFLGLVISVVLLFAGGSELLQSLERTAYDFGVRISERSPTDKVAIIAVDDQSIANIGRWPWPRDIHARLLELLHEGQAKVVGNTVFFLEPQIDPGLLYINELAEFFVSSNLYQARSTLAPEIADDIGELEAQLAGALSDLDTDRKLSAAMEQAGNVVLAIPFVLGEPRGKPDDALPGYVVRNALPNIVDEIGAEANGFYPLPAVAAIPPIPGLGDNAFSIGHLNANADVDGGIRSEPLVLRYYDTYYPSLSVQLAAASLNLTSEDIQVRLGEGIRLGNLSIGTDRALQMLTFFYGHRDGGPAFPVDSFYDVFTGKIPAEKYRDKIVLIGATATGVGTPQVTPVSPAMAPVLTLAHSVSSILNEDFFVTPEWGHWAEWGAFLLIALYIIVVLPRLKAGVAAAITAVLFTALVATHFSLMVSQTMWLKLMVPATLLLAGHLLLTTKRFLVTERGKEKSEAESAESNRMLGLAYQGQGQLDMAFEKFRKVPLDGTVMDLLYNLALDFERKRQFNKAGAVYQYMADYNPKFRDLEQRMSRSRAMEETVLLGAGGATGPGGTMLLDASGGVEKPMLGRYQVEKELGKGAMGIVYLGRDPKINRIVAIKTMALSQEFEADELADVKERFFREAETAGRLNHPNIVTIYDAGEEHDLAYIAMEFLKGRDLAPYTKTGNLLPLKKVLDIVTRSAEALDYAHGQNVVHRDIKPANIMYEADTGNLKLTDFGIARITDSSKTKTGMVLGTPSYMSPEQLSGKKVDGRSDLFSLGVMLYQLVSGVLPFQGDSMATLMFKIANEPHPDVSGVQPDIPPCVKSIIDRALAKDANERYQRGAQMVRDLRVCEEQISP